MDGLVPAGAVWGGVAIAAAKQANPTHSGAGFLALFNTPLWIKKPRLQKGFAINEENSAH
ncbi:hypothetical protein [Magnetofaba australis]|uniref:hypothetical protein n=1 Tax=Magnetofaba australis TaxID=1472297 RepID=UPI00117BE901|nr:hypothetical protein [Magnetofaba australis]